MGGFYVFVYIRATDCRKNIGLLHRVKGKGTGMTDSSGTKRKADCSSLSYALVRKPGFGKFIRRPKPGQKRGHSQATEGNEKVCGANGRYASTVRCSSG